MYHIEIAHRYFKSMVDNKTRVEGCIAKAFYFKEVVYFSSIYSAEENNVNGPTMRYNVDEEPSLWRPLHFQWKHDLLFVLRRKEGCFSIHVC